MTNGPDDLLGVPGALTVSFIEAIWPYADGPARRAALALIGPFDPAEGHGPDEFREAWPHRLPVSVRQGVLTLLGAAGCDPDRQVTWPTGAPRDELLRVAAAWPRLPAAVRAGIVAMVEAAKEDSHVP